MSTNGKTRADRYKEDNAKLLMERLQGYGYIDQTIKNINNLEDLTKEMDAIEVTRIKAATDIRIKLLNKIVPDRKAIELTGKDGGPIHLTHDEWIESLD